MTVAAAQRAVDNARARRDGTITGHAKALKAAVNAALRRELAEHFDRRTA